MPFLSFIARGLIEAAYAQSYTAPCFLPSFACLYGGSLSAYLGSTVVNTALISLGSVAVAVILFYGIRLLLLSESDSAVNETRQAFEYAIFGAFLVMGAAMLASTFTDIHPITAEVGGGTNLWLATIVLFLRALIGAAVIVNISIQGFRLIVANEEGDLDKAKTRFMRGLFGAAIVLLASPIVFVFDLPGRRGGDITIAYEQLVGIANFLITIFGLLAVVSIIVAGIFLIVSVDESLKDRAKKTIFAALIAVIVVIASAAIVNLFIGVV